MEAKYIIIAVPNMQVLEDVTLTIYDQYGAKYEVTEEDYVGFATAVKVITTEFKNTNFISVKEKGR